MFKNQTITHRDLQVANSPRNIRLLREWLADCQSHHDECKRGTYSGKTYDKDSTTTYLPFRVIDVGSTASTTGENARLYTAESRTLGRYMTLSHCWGKVIPPRLTRKTVDAWHERLPDEELPQTFRDAIWLTRELGERFLWIDSLCIVQDDPAELQTQIGLMGAIFEESFCTIAAVDAKGSDGAQASDSGLFISGPDNVKIAKFQVEVTASGEDNNDHQHADTAEELCEVRLQEAPKPAYPFPLRLEAKAWHSRGWVFQERELSRRCIFFTEDDLGWRCNRYWETEQTGVPERRWHRGDYNMDSSTAYGGVSYDSEFNLRKTWQNAVNKYSRTKLTFDSDKHNALMGFEERLTTRFGHVFHNGIVDFGQNENTLCQLLWIPEVSRGELNSIRFPSWSWMNVKGSAKWAHSEYLIYPELLAQVKFGDPESDGMQDLHLSGTSQNVRIGGPVGDIPHYTEFERWAPDLHFGWSELDLHQGTNTLLAPETEEIIGWIIIDVAPGHDLKEVSALPLLRYLRQDDEYEPMCVDFLALSRVPTHSDSTVSHNNQTWQRVGRGRILKSAFEWLENCQPGSFTVA